MIGESPISRQTRLLDAGQLSGPKYRKSRYENEKLEDFADRLFEDFAIQYCGCWIGGQKPIGGLGPFISPAKRCFSHGLVLL